MNNILSYSKATIVGIIIAVSASFAYAAWNDPTATPPGDNAPAPINVSMDTQFKGGVLGVGSLFRAYNYAIIGGGLAVNTNFWSTTGEQPLKLDVGGAAGASYYCDEDGNNCFTADEVGGSGSSDTLAGLSCSTNQVAKYNGTSWVCAADETGSPGSDTLADLTCTTDQIAKYDGSAWVCADESGGSIGSTPGTVVGGCTAIDASGQEECWGEAHTTFVGWGDCNSGYTKVHELVWKDNLIDPTCNESTGNTCSRIIESTYRSFLCIAS